MRTLLSKGNGTWLKKEQHIGWGKGIYEHPAHIGDVNGDGRADIIFPFLDWRSGKKNKLTVRTLLSKSNGTWLKKEQHIGWGKDTYENPAQLGDINGDKKTDILLFRKNCCIHNCIKGQKKKECIDQNTLLERVCRKDYYGCRQWVDGQRTYCSSGCDNGACKCYHKCGSKGQKKCRNNDIYICDVNSNGCRYWKKHKECEWGCSSSTNKCKSPPILNQKVSFTRKCSTWGACWYDKVSLGNGKCSYSSEYRNAQVTRIDNKNSVSVRLGHGLFYIDIPANSKTYLINHLMEGDWGVGSHGGQPELLNFTFKYQCIQAK